MIKSTNREYHTGYTMHGLQDGIKVKEEPVDATFSTDTSQDYTCVKNDSMITHEEAFSSNNLHVNVNNKENNGLSNNCPIQVENVKKSLSLKRKSAEIKKGQIVVNSSKKSRKCSNETVNEHRHALRKSAIKNSQSPIKRKCAIPFIKIKKPRTFSCDVCFREFSSLTNCVLHKQYYEFIGEFKCKECTKCFTTRDNLRTHITVCHCKNMRCISSYHCNFCSRTTKDKIFLQSHLFHAHKELICSTNITKAGDFKREDLTSANTSYENDVLEQEKSLHSNNAITVEESNTVFTNDTNQSLHENMLKTEELMVEKSFNNKLTPMKQLRQPTLAEYLELGKKKRDVKSSPNNLNILKDHLLTFALHRNEDDEKIKNVKSNFLEEHNGQTISPVKQSSNSSEEHNGQSISPIKQSSNSLEEHNGQPTFPVKQSSNSSEEHNGQPISPIKQSSNSLEEHNGQPTSPVKQSSNSSEEHNRQPISPIKQSSNSSKQITQSTVKQTKKDCLRKPFVKLHADVEMMKSFLEKLPTIKHEENGNHRNNILRYDHEVPYSLRSSRKNVSFRKTNVRLRNREGRFISKMSQFNSDNFKTEQVTHSNKADSSFEKIPIAHFKCKECIIPLQRCNDNIKNDKVSTVDIMVKEENASLNVQSHYDPTSSQDTNIPSKTLKELEISVKRLSTVPVVNTVTVGTVSDIEKKNHDRFVCKVCKVCFPSKSAKREHIKSFHIAYMSSICNARYTMKHKLLQHYLREHPVKQNQCCVCLALFSDYIELKRHLYIHCLKYVQKENDQYPVNIEVKCKLNKKKYKCLQCNKVFQSQSVLKMHQNCCLIQNEIGDQKDSIKEVDNLSNNILKISHNKNNDEIIAVRQDDKISPNDLPESSNNSEKTPEKCPEPSLDSEKLKITEDNEKSPVNNNNSIAEEIETVNKLEDSKKSSEDNVSANNDQDVHTVSAQLDATDSKVIIYPCDICGKQFQNQRNLQQHIRTFNGSTDVCPICGTAFSSKRLLQSHIAAAHVPQISNTYNFHCVFCNQGFIKKHELRPHVLHLHSQQMINTFTYDSFVTQEKSDISARYTSTCKVCNLMFETQDRYIEHRMYYYKNHTFTCVLCTQNFQGMYMFHHHNKLVHSSQDKRNPKYSYICEICKEGFNHESHFHSHTMHVHSNEDTLANAAKKPEEKNKFDSISEEILGEQIVQSKIINLFAKQRKEIEQSFMNEYICRVCHMRCSNLDDMIKHKTFYSNDGDFKCDKCNRQCKTLDILTQHKKLTHTYRDIFNGHACYDCGEILETVTSLTYHEKHFHPISAQSNIDVLNSAKSKNYDQTSSPNTACKPQQSESNNRLENEYKYRCLFCNTRFSSVHTVQTHIIKTHIDDILVKQVTSNSTLSTIHDIGMQKKTVPQRIEAGQASSSNNNPTQFPQQVNTIVRTVLPEKRQNPTTIESPNSLNMTMLYRGSDNVVQKILTPTILKESDTNPTFTVPALNKEFNVKTSIPTYSKSTYSHQTNDRVVSKSEPANKLIPIKSIPVNRSVTKVYKTLFILPPLQPIATIATNRKPVLQNNYICPLCPLEYPSLMFFHAHMRYAHADSVRTNMRNVQLNQSAQKASVIECLLCPYTFTDECNYKKHLKNSHAHYVYIPSSKMGKTANDTSDSATNNNKKIINSEIITIDDDDDDNDDDNNIKNTPDQSTTKVTSVAVSSVPEQQDEKIGKLKVRSFARIIEHSSTDHALKNLQPT